MAHISHMNNPSTDDIDKPGGWLFRVRTPPDLAHLALQLRFLTDSESIGNHDSKIVGACGVD